jgi:hypothetical protein
MRLERNFIEADTISTMSSEPAKPGDQATRHKLSALSKALLGLHKTLLDSERVGYEQSFGTIPTPAAFLNLVMGDPWFAWLRSLSEFIVQIDERLDDKATAIPPEVAGEFVARARALLTPSEDGLGFGLHYHNAMQRDPDVILAHAGMVRLMTSLEDSKKPE